MLGLRLCIQPQINESQSSLLQSTYSPYRSCKCADEAHFRIDCSNRGSDVLHQSAESRVRFGIALKLRLVLMCLSERSSLATTLLESGSG